MRIVNNIFARSNVSPTKGGVREPAIRKNVISGTAQVEVLETFKAD